MKTNDLDSTREQARHADGKFGVQTLSTPEKVDLVDASPAQKATTLSASHRFATASTIDELDAIYETAKATNPEMTKVEQWELDRDWDHRADEIVGRPTAADRVKELTGRESSTLRRLPRIADVLRVSDRLAAGHGYGYAPTGPAERQTIIDQIGSGTFLGISGGRVLPLPDGVDLPVSSGYSVRVRLADNDTYTVQRVLRRGDKETVKGELRGVHCDPLPDIAWKAHAFRSDDFGQAPTN